MIPAKHKFQLLLIVYHVSSQKERQQSWVVRLRVSLSWNWKFFHTHMNVFRNEFFECFDVFPRNAIIFGSFGFSSSSIRSSINKIFLSFSTESVESRFRLLRLVDIQNITLKTRKYTNVMEESCLIIYITSLKTIKLLGNRLVLCCLSIEHAVLRHQSTIEHCCVENLKEEFHFHEIQECQKSWDSTWDFPRTPEPAARRTRELQSSVNAASSCYKRMKYLNYNP